MDDVLTNLIMIIILQYIHVSNYYTVHLKHVLYCQLFLNKGGKYFLYFIYCVLLSSHFLKLKSKIPNFSQYKFCQPTLCLDIKDSQWISLMYFSTISYSQKAVMLMLSCSVVYNSLQLHGLPGSSVHGILQARILEWVAIPFSLVSSQSRDGLCLLCLLH